MVENRNRTPDNSPETPLWLQNIGNAYHDVLKEDKQARNELGLKYSHEGSIDIEESRRVREAYYNGLPKIANGLPEAILLYKEDGGRVYDPFDKALGTLTYANAVKIFYLPQTNERLEYRPSFNLYLPTLNNLVEITDQSTQDHDPESENFKGIEFVRNNPDHKVSINKVNEDQKDLNMYGLSRFLSDGEITIILAKAQETLTDPQQLKTLEQMRDEIDDINKQRAARIQAAGEKHGKTLNLLVNNFATEISNKFTLPEVIPQQSSYHDRHPEHYYLPKEGKLIVIPTKKITIPFVKKSFWVLDSFNSEPADLNDWLNYSRTVVNNIISSIPKKYQDYLQNIT